jgi:hypothetical protein
MCEGNFSILTILFNLKRIESWPNNKVLDISGLTGNQQPSTSIKKRETAPWWKRKNQTTIQRSVWMTAAAVWMHIVVKGPGPSKATCMALTIYHNIPTDFISGSVAEKIRKVYCAG